MGIATINIQTVECETEFQALAPVWNQLLEKSRAKSVFLTWEWIDTWWRTYRHRFKLLVLVATENDEPCGIAPLIVRQGETARLEFFGQNKAYGEYLDFIVPSGRESLVTPKLCKKIAELHRLGVWRNMNLAVVREDSASLPLITSALRQQGIEINKSAARFCPYVELPPSWDSYLKQKSGKLRKQIRYNESRLARIGRVKIEFPLSISQVDEFFDDLVYLHSQRWNKAPDDVFFDFHRRIAHRFFPLNRLLLARLRVGQDIVAAKYDFVFDNRVWGYQGGWQTTFKKLEVGSVMLCEIFKHCIQQGIREYDFLEGDDWYKRRWSTASCAAYDLTFGNAGSAFIFKP